MINILELYLTYEIFLYFIFIYLKKKKKKKKKIYYGMINQLK